MMKMLKKNKSIKVRRQEAKEDLRSCLKVISHMEKYLYKDEAMALELGSAFLHILKYHMEHGDLMPTNVHLAALLRRSNDT